MKKHLAIPAILTPENWDKKKGLIAKAFTPTDVGKWLTALVGSHSRVNWAKFAPPPGDADVEEINRLKRAAEDAYKSDLAAVKAMARKVVEHAHDAAVSWKNNKSIPASSTKHALAVEAAAKDYINKIENTEWADPFDQAIRARLLADAAAEKLAGKIAQQFEAISSKLAKLYGAIENIGTSNVPAPTNKVSFGKLVAYIKKSEATLQDALDTFAKGKALLASIPKGAGYDAELKKKNEAELSEIKPVMDRALKAHNTNKKFLETCMRDLKASKLI